MWRDIQIQRELWSCALPLKNGDEWHSAVVCIFLPKQISVSFAFEWKFTLPINMCLSLSLLVAFLVPEVHKHVALQKFQHLGILFFPVV